MNPSPPRPPTSLAPARLAWFKIWLLVPILVYFVAATYWQVQRMRNRPQ